MVLAQKAARALMVMALLQTLQQLNCSRAIDLDPSVAHSAEFQDLLNVYTSQTALEELAQIVSTRSNLVRMRLMRNRRRRLLVCIMFLHQQPERRSRGCVSDLLPDMLKPAFPAKSDLPPTCFFVNFFVAKNKDRLPKITVLLLFYFFFHLLPKA